MANVVEILFAVSGVLFVLGFVMAWQAGDLARRVVHECGVRAVARAEKEERLLEVARALSGSFKRADKVNADAALDTLTRLALMEALDETFTCDGCDERRSMADGHVRWFGLEFCSDECRKNPLPFDAPAITADNASHHVDRLLN